MLDSMVMVAEGVRTTQERAELAKKHGVEMPISEQMYLVLFEDKSPEGGHQRTSCSRDPKPEHGGALTRGTPSEPRPRTNGGPDAGLIRACLRAALC